MSKMKEKKECICCSPGAVDITGCRVSLYPMCDKFVDVILQAVDKTDTSKVWSDTDHTSTIYRGRQSQVVNCVQALFVNAWRKNVHMVGEFTFSRGCPGDVEADSFLETDDIPCNVLEEIGEVKTFAKISFYAFGTSDYMEHIRYIVELAAQKGLKPKSAHYVTIVEGSANAIFTYFDEALAYSKKHLSHYVLEATLSVNSPSVVK
jgi:YKOF-related Family.